MLRFLLLLLVSSLSFSNSFALVTPNRGGVRSAFVLRMEPQEGDGLGSSQPTTKKSSRPCWQDIYDEDCTMDSIFSASFVPSEWIKQLPCGAGMEDCDFPEDALLPEIRPESHSEINVMDFLNIKRVEDTSNSKLTP